MRQITKLSFIAVLATAPLLLISTGAEAEVSRTFVSGEGSDTGACPVTAPCRSFAYAIGQTNAGGEIAVLSTAGYGAVTITKAISITNEAGVEAGVTVTTASDAITINAGSSDVVNLRGLTLIGGGVGNNGITFNSGGTLNIENAVIGGFTSNGLNLAPSGSSQINVSDTTVTGSGQIGIYLGPTGSGATVQAYFERVLAFRNSSDGFAIFGGNAHGTTIQATAADCAASGSSAPGISVVGSPSTAQPTFFVVNSKVVNNKYGVSANSATLILALTSIYGNSSDGYIVIGTGTINSFGNNFIGDTNNSGDLTAIGPQ